MYLYNIEVNFNKYFYDYFDWNKNDTIIHIKKIPILKVNNLEDILYQKVIFSKETIQIIYDKTEVITNRNVEHLKYACILTDKIKSIAVILDNKGNIKKISDLTIIDDIEVDNIIHKIKIEEVKYQIIKKTKKIIFLTRKEKEIKKFLVSKLNVKTDYNQLAYLYLESFNKRENDITKIVKELQLLLENNWEKYYLKIYNFFKVTM